MDVNARTAAERHIAEHSLGEAARISRLLRIREFVLGPRTACSCHSASSRAWQPPIQRDR
jgi:hypothetical protein